MNKILFLCTGNYYRSRFAEHLFNWLATKQGLDWQADSRGLALERGINNVGAISRYALEALPAFLTSFAIAYLVIFTQNRFQAFFAANNFSTVRNT
ncbi:arsenate reductase/protein-tyrosine-phosphatase family protein [Nostoc mirabile]|uniref:arsenate reductase/protein-tyrosine-phosphatase family protein n=1 Tax=Nostoc mirabile TaxID=2907820 RepID=UPI003556DE2D